MDRPGFSRSSGSPHTYDLKTRPVCRGSIMEKSSGGFSSGPIKRGGLGFTGTGFRGREPAPLAPVHCTPQALPSASASNCPSLHHHERGSPMKNRKRESGRRVPCRSRCPALVSLARARTSDDIRPRPHNRLANGLSIGRVAFVPLDVGLHASNPTRRPVRIAAAEAACAEPSLPLHRPRAPGKTFFAKSKPTVVISLMGGSLFAGGFDQPALWQLDARMGAIHPITRSPRRRGRAASAAR